MIKSDDHKLLKRSFNIHNITDWILRATFMINVRIFLAPSPLHCWCFLTLYTYRTDVMFVNMPHASVHHSAANNIPAVHEALCFFSLRYRNVLTLRAWNYLRQRVNGAAPHIDYNLWRKVISTFILKGDKGQTIRSLLILTTLELWAAISLTVESTMS